MNSRDSKPLIFCNQKFTDLSAIQIVAIGIPAIMIGKTLSIKYGVEQAICSIFIGNLLLWLFGMSVISMAYEKRMNALENIQFYLGNFCAKTSGFILILSFINWFALETNATVPTLLQSLQFETTTSKIQYGAGIGLLTALLSLGGIELIRKLSVISFFPIFIFYILNLKYFNIDFDFSQASISVPGIFTVALLLLPGITNLPTFFRHTRSLSDCYLAFSLMIVFTSVFEISTIWMEIPVWNSFIGTSFSFIFVIITLIATNLVNIYFASACLEYFIPNFTDTKGYTIIGLLGTVMYTFFQLSAPILFLENLSNSYFAILGVTLLLAFFSKIAIKHRIRHQEKNLNTICWIAGCLASTWEMLFGSSNANFSLILGLYTCVFLFMIFIFIEENLWALKKIHLSKK